MSHLKKSFTVCAFATTMLVTLPAIAVSEPAEKGGNKPTPNWCDTEFPLATPGKSRTVTTNSEVPDIHHALCNTMINIESLRDEYQGTKDHIGKIAVKRKWQSAFDGSLIGLGIASVASAFYGAPVSAIGGIAISASGLQQYRSYYDPSGEGLAYIKAVKAARCVSTDAEYLLNDTPQPLWDAIQSLKKAIAKVQSSSGQLQSAASSSGLSQTEQAKASTQSDTGATAAQAALTAANSALSAAIAEARAYNDAPATVDAAHDAIKDYIDLALHRTSVDYSGLQTAITNAVQSATTVESGVQQAQSGLLAAVSASAKANASSGASPTGVAPATPATKTFKAAVADIPADSATPNAATTAGGSTPMTAQAATAAAQDNAGAVANLIAATSNVLLYTQDKRYTNLTNQISTTCVAALSS